MRKIALSGILLVVTVGVIAILVLNNQSKLFPLNDIAPSAMTDDLSFKLPNMLLSSPMFKHEELIPPKYTCDGENISPPLNIENIPEDTLSLALVVYDPDAPSGDWVHWIIWNIPPETTMIQEGEAIPNATQGLTNFGNSGYGGPCPPSGTHRYIFKLYALKLEKIDLGEVAKRDQLEQEISGNILDSTELIGMYSRV